MNADKKNTEVDSKSSSGNNNSSPSKTNKGGDSEENGSGDAKDTKNGAKKFEGPMALGEIAFIDKNITSTKIDGLQPLYQICFDVAGKAQTLKKNLRTFKGFAFKEDSADYTKKVDSVTKLDIKVLKAICDILDVDKKGANKEIAERICQFLLCPEGEPEPSEDEEAGEEEEDEEESEEEEKPKKKGSPMKKGGATGGRPRRSTAGRNFNTEDFLSSEESDDDEPKPKGKRKRGDTDSGSDYNPSVGSDSDTGRKKRATGTRRSARYQSNSEDDDDDFMSSDEESDVPKRKRGAPARRSAPARGGRGKKKQSESEESEPEEDSDESDAPKRKKAPAKKGSAAASPAKGKGRPKRVAASTKKKARDQTTSEEEDDVEEEEEIDEELSHLQGKDDSEDEPLAKKPKPGFPTDDEIKVYVKKILDKANLEEITMKTVCKDVYAQFPGHDLTHKKDFIKATVKSLIAS